MRRALTEFLLIFICFLLQCTVFKWLSLGGISPNLLLIVTASCGFMMGDTAGLFTGLVCGLLVDIFFGDYIGLYGLFYMYIGFLDGKFSRIFYPEDIKLPLFLIFLSDITYGMFCYIALYLLQGKFELPYYFMKIIVPEAVYTILISVLLYPLLLWIHKRLSARERGIKEIV